MFSNPNRQEIDNHTMKLIVGIIAISLASVTSYFSECKITSISASYHEGGWARDYFVGSLYAIFAFLLAYNGQLKVEMILSKVAAFAALGVAMFPCPSSVDECPFKSYEELIPGLHGVCAAVMFLILAIFCFLFRARAKKKQGVEAKYRCGIYSICGVVMVTSILILALDPLIGGSISAVVGRLTFYSEMAGLLAFGVAWLTASRVLPILTNVDERCTLFS